MGMALNQFTELPRWVAWRNEKRGHRLTKIPYSPHGGRQRPTIRAPGAPARKPKRAPAIS